MQATCLWCMLDETMSGKPMGLKVINKKKGDLKLLYRKNGCLKKKSFAECSAILLFSLILINLNEETKKKIQKMQNKCIRFCLKLHKMHYISEEEFRLINWLPTGKGVDQCINTITNNFVNNAYPYYLNEIFELGTRNNFFKLKNPFCKTNIGQKIISKIDSSIWNSLPDSIKKANSLNTFKRNVKKHYLT